MGNIHTGTIRDIEVFDNISKRIGYTITKISDYSIIKNNPLKFLSCNNKYRMLKAMKVKRDHQSKYTLFKLESLERKISKRLSYGAIKLTPIHNRKTDNIFRKKPSKISIGFITNVDKAIFLKPATMKELCILIRTTPDR